jgi:hypothetical protein
MIYIISDEEITNGDWVLYKNKYVNRVKEKDSCGYICSEACKPLFHEVKKIILTNDPDLIKDGVQEIDDKFLEWFTNNPGCKFVEIQKGFADGSAYGYNFLDYKIIIPQEDLTKEEEDTFFVNHVCGIQEKPKQDRTCTNNCSVICGECQIFKPNNNLIL